MESYIRILHASPDAPPVDVYVNGNKAASNLAYKQFTEYLEVKPGKYNVRVYPAGVTFNPVIDTIVEIPEKQIFTIAAAGMLSAIGLVVVPEPLMSIPPGKLYVRFAHLSPCPFSTIKEVIAK